MLHKAKRNIYLFSLCDIYNSFLFQSFPFVALCVPILIIYPICLPFSSCALNNQTLATKQTQKPQKIYMYVYTALGIRSVSLACCVRLTPALSVLVGFYLWHLSLDNHMIWMPKQPMDVSMCRPTDLANVIVWILNTHTHCRLKCVAT